MGKLIAVSGCSLEITTTGVMGSPTISPESLPSTKVKIQGKGVYYDSISIIIPTATYNTSFTASGITLSIDGTSSESSTEGKPFLLEGDEGTANQVVFTNPNSGATATVNVTVKIKTANQNVVNVT